MNDSITAIKQSLKDWLLSADFTAVLAALAVDLGYEVPGPAIVYTHERAAAMPERFPSAEMLGLNSAPQGDTSMQHYHHAVEVLWTVNGDDEATVVREVEGLLLATRRLTYRRTLDLADGTTAPVMPGVENYGPLLSRRHKAQQPLVKAGTIRLTVPTFA